MFGNGLAECGAFLWGKSEMASAIDSVWNNVDTDLMWQNSGKGQNGTAYSPSVFMPKSSIEPAAYNINAGLSQQDYTQPETAGWWDKTKNFMGSSLGRSLGAGLLTGGLVGLTGGSGLEVLSYGAQAGGKASKTYLNEKDKQRKQEMQNKYYETKLAQDQADREYRQLELANKTAKDSEMKNIEFENALKLLDAKKQADIEKERLTGGGNTESLDAIEQQLNAFTQSFDKMPSKANAYTEGFIRNLTGTLEPEVANFNSQRSLLFNKIARDLGGDKGVLSDQDIQRISDALPTMYDSNEQKIAKMQAVYQLLDIARQRQNGGSTPQQVTNSFNNDPLGIR